MPERRTTAAALLIFAAVAGVFWPAVRFPHLRWDDALNISGNEWLRFDRLGLIWMLTGAKLGHWQPLTWLSLALDRAVFGPGPFGHHLVNILLHALNAVLLFRLALELSGEGASARAVRAAAFAALLWALHPLRVESVAWATERRDVLCGAFALAAALAYVRGKERWALVLSVLAMGSKVFAVVLPAVWLVLDLRLRGRPLWKEKLPYLPFCFVVLVINIGAQAASGASIPLARFGLGSRTAQAFYNLAFYPWKTLCPFGLAPLYEPSFLLEPRPFTVAAAAVAVTAIVILLVRRRSPALAHAALAYVILLLPALGLFKSGRMAAADRWSYMPMIPLCLLAAGSAARRLDGAVWRTLAVAALAALVPLTRLQLAVWSSDRALWERGVAASPNSWFAAERLAEALAAEGDEPAAAAARAGALELRRSVLERAARARALRGEPAQ